MNDISMKYTGKIIKSLREQTGESQEQLAVAIGAPNRETIARWENGSRELKRENIISISKHFDVSTDYLLGLSSRPTQKQQSQLDDNLSLLQENANIHSLDSIINTLANIIQNQNFKDETEKSSFFSELDDLLFSGIQCYGSLEDIFDESKAESLNIEQLQAIIGRLNVNRNGDLYALAKLNKATEKITNKLNVAMQSILSAEYELRKKLDYEVKYGKHNPTSE